VNLYGNSVKGGDEKEGRARKGGREKVGKRWEVRRMRWGIEGQAWNEGRGAADAQRTKDGDAKIERGEQKIEMKQWEGSEATREE
jgi:hypothetical protein